MPAFRPRIVYRRHYDIGLAGLQRLHPFDSRKYGRAWRMLRRRFGRKLDALRVTPPRAVGPEELLRVHTPEYLRRRYEPYLIRDAVWAVTA